MSLAISNVFPAYLIVSFLMNSQSGLRYWNLSSTRSKCSSSQMNSGNRWVLVDNDSDKVETRMRLQLLMASTSTSKTFLSDFHRVVLLNLLRSIARFPPTVRLARSSISSLAACSMAMRSSSTVTRLPSISMILSPGFSLSPSEFAIVSATTQNLPRDGFSSMIPKNASSHLAGDAFFSMAGSSALADVQVATKNRRVHITEGCIAGLPSTTGELLCTNAVLADSLAACPESGSLSWPVAAEISKFSVAGRFDCRCW